MIINTTRANHYHITNKTINYLFMLIFFISPADAKKNTYNYHVNNHRNYQQTKLLARQIFEDAKISFYCGCKFDQDLLVHLPSCKYIPQKHTKKPMKIEWEHIVPASYFGKQMKSGCWTKKPCSIKNNKVTGRKCCLLIDPLYRTMHNDLHNLVPSIAEINAARKDYRFGYVNNKEQKYKSCPIKIDPNLKIVEPRDEVKGIIARVYLYYYTTYNIFITPNQLILFKKWNNQFPPTPFEFMWNNKVAQIQKNDNEFIINYKNNL